MKKLAISILGIVLLATSMPAITANQILDKVDNNMVASSMKFEAELKISISGSVRNKEFKGYTKGEDKAYMEFTSPSRDKGTRFLKLADEFWMYLPDVGKATKIAGHAMRSSLMGSDFSYEDAVSNEELQESYDADLQGEQKIGDDNCYVLKLSLKEGAEGSYYTQKLWVSKETFIPIKSEYYSKSGKLMKDVQILSFKRISGKNYPTRIRMENKLRRNTWSEFVITDIQIGVLIPSNVFTKGYLER
ncbi:outer membrane lipoprotein-sorting protein [candidate division WOR-3 bacterium]|uniref:Outer membrane lipoprotein-sorting protein n=1 Tax=candidate division WOR-3 bacterium TaxID=2052148 RepID=A0A9D5QD59_UNCW3|nr:outer membrane lipoprotein-sorting protein [candidate division WOR-3 bacterium]MBD3365279.1 outer membrane lipoprotein-sorting protein [candidate division WOR-3 bacterium]